MSKSSTLTDTLKEILEFNSTANEGPTKHYQKIAAAAAAKALTSAGDDSNTELTGQRDKSIRNFTFNPYSCRCTWVQFYDNQECLIEMFSVEYQSPNPVDNLRHYHPGQGIHLIVTHGSSRYGAAGGTRISAANSKRYVHRDTYRGLDTTFYQILSGMATAAQKEGLDGIKFPDNWDPIPYD